MSLAIFLRARLSSGRMFASNYVNSPLTFFGAYGLSNLAERSARYIFRTDIDAYEKKRAQTY